MGQLRTVQRSGGLMQVSRSEEKGNVPLLGQLRTIPRSGELRQVSRSEEMRNVPLLGELYRGLENRGKYQRKYQGLKK